MIFSNYSLDKLIQNRKNKRIFIGTDTITLQKVVIKIYDDKSKSKESILRDIHIPSKLNHPNIIKIKDYVEDLDSNKMYVIYPYIDDTINLRNLPVDKFDVTDLFKLYYILDILIQVVDAINYMHDNNIVHRDIKPDNILVNDKVHLIDFDLSDQLDNPKFPIRKGTIGTPNFMAPEIWWKINQVDYKKTDIYSLGITMYYLLNKRKLPYKAKNYSELEYQIANHKPKISNSGYPELDKLIMKTIDKDPQNRPTISEIKQKFNHFKTVVESRINFNE